MERLFTDISPSISIIILMAIFVAALSLERFLYLSKALLISGKMGIKISRMIQYGQFELAQYTCQKNEMPVGRIIQMGIKMRDFPIMQLRQNMENALKNEEKFLYQGIYLIEASAILGPLIGFLGTLLNWKNILSIANEDYAINYHTITNAFNNSIDSCLAGLILATFSIFITIILNSRINKILFAHREISESLIQALEKSTITSRIVPLKIKADAEKITGISKEKISVQIQDEKALNLEKDREITEDLKENKDISNNEKDAETEEDADKILQKTRQLTQTDEEKKDLAKESVMVLETQDIPEKPQKFALEKAKTSELDLIPDFLKIKKKIEDENSEKEPRKSEETVKKSEIEKPEKPAVPKANSTEKKLIFRIIRPEAKGDRNIEEISLLPREEGEEISLSEKQKTIRRIKKRRIRPDIK